MLWSEPDGTLPPASSSLSAFKNQAETAALVPFVACKRILNSWRSTNTEGIFTDVVMAPFLSDLTVPDCTPLTALLFVFQSNHTLNVWFAARFLAWISTAVSSSTSTMDRLPVLET